jgi:predicted  nucleic acid-binding Zn-ribbon protein
MTNATALDEKVRRLEEDVDELQRKVDDANSRADDAKRTAAGARQDLERITADLRKTTKKAEDVDKALKERMQEEALRARETSGFWMGAAILSSLGMLTWSLVTGKFMATLEYIRQFASGRSQ